MKKKKYLTVKEAGDEYGPALKESYIRYLILNADTMGFRKCFHEINSKKIINRKKFEEFVDER